MNVMEKIRRSWWVLISFFMFLNGFGFVYIGFKHNNRNWVLEGIAYEIPWIMYFIVYAAFNVQEVSMSNPTALLVYMSFILMFVSIVRSIWVAVKLADVYEYNEKYTIRQTHFNPQSNGENNQDSSLKFACCICALCVFFIFVIMGIL